MGKGKKKENRESEFRNGVEHRTEAEEEVEAEAGFRHTHTHIHTHSHTFTHTFTHIHTHSHTHSHSHIHTFTHTDRTYFSVMFSWEMRRTSKSKESESMLTTCLRAKFCSVPVKNAWGK